MNQSVHQEPELSIFGDPIARMERALSDLMMKIAKMKAILFFPQKI